MTLTKTRGQEQHDPNPDPNPNPNPDPNPNPKCYPCQCPRSAPSPLQDAPDRSGWLGALRGETGPLGAQPLPRALELAASNVAHFPAFDHLGGGRTVGGGPRLLRGGEGNPNPNPNPILTLTLTLT